MHAALSIAGSDPTGGAGLQQDLQVFRHFGVHGMAIATALTVQDTTRVHSVLPAFPSVVLDQIRVLMADLRPDAIKLGMLATDDVTRSVALGLRGVPEPAPPLVIDPVLAASDGTALLERRGWGALVELFAGAALVTPNLTEAGALTGIDVSDAAGAERAARHFVEELGAEAALVKGGHRDGPPVDWLALREADGVRTLPFEAERLPGPPVHGTGCALSAAVTAALARGAGIVEAVQSARSFVRAAIEGAVAVGGGARLLGFPGSDQAG